VSGVFGEFEPITIITPMLIWPAVASDQPGYVVLKRIKEIAPLKVHAGSTCRIALSTVEILTTAQRMYTAKGTDRNLDQIAREQNMNRRTLRRANPDIGRRVPLGAAIRIPISLQVPENSIPTVRLSRLRVHIDDPAAIQLRLPNGEPLNLADKSVYAHEMRQILLVSIIDLPWKCIDGDATDSDSIASAGTMEVMNMTRVTSAGKTQVAACIDEELGDAPITQTKVLVHRDNFDGDEWEDVSDEAKDLIRKLIAKPERRLTADEALKHKWFKMHK
jgi:serine/threonine protein kinase